MTLMQETSVEVRDLKVSYGSFNVLDGLSLDIYQGEFLVLLGSSGCGKSTLLNAIAGLQDTADGSIAISGRDVTFTPPKDRGIGMVFQSYALYPQMTVAQNMGFGLKVRKMKAPEIEARITRAAEILQITHLLKRKPSDLSGGQRQRVAIGRALVRDVDVFLFDEPLSNLDAQLRTDLRVELKKLHQNLGNTMIYVTHDQVEAMTLADRIAVMKDGRIQQLAPPDEIYARPANLFVAGFIGSPKMNLIAGSLEQGTTFTAPGLRIALPGIQARPTSGGLTLGLRPEHLTLLPEGAVATGPVIEGTVDLVEALGPETIVWLRAGDSTIALRCDPRSAPAQGATARALISLQDASLFETETGDRLDFRPLP
ncbi:ABC transporter ATP-binding protein [Pseudooceanicola sp. CBS1P-1]|uniref:ATP-binding cassette domain-containing protein n=1 Tax=Pseudooceanicola albus TaxID=2692189 RepID=A0A6L7G3C1_9RHOB|nr:MULTISPECIES: ABC transporter ATP-binding protein [Pseudooceanicola]MBT9385287.1 ABC transporter ATP-binding protein [Pseudooceanicola endophyticus]MXN18854.1 ATP-binding cassette domain-containing protein [Pseudooceanicola albus]